MEGKIVEKWYEGKQKSLRFTNVGRVNYSDCLYEGIPGKIHLSKRDVPVSESSNNRNDSKVWFRPRISHDRH